MSSWWPRDADSSAQALNAHAISLVFHWLTSIGSFSDHLDSNKHPLIAFQIDLENKWPTFQPFVNVLCLIFWIHNQTQITLCQ